MFDYLNGFLTCFLLYSVGLALTEWFKRREEMKRPL